MIECPNCAAHDDVAEAEHELQQATAVLALSLLRLVDIQRRMLALQTTVLDDLYVGLTAIARPHTDDSTAKTVEEVMERMKCPPHLRLGLP